MSFNFIFLVKQKCAASLKVASGPTKSVPKSTGRTLRSSKEMEDNEKKELVKFSQESKSGKSGRRKEEDIAEKLKVYISSSFSFLNYLILNWLGFSLLNFNCIYSIDLILFFAWTGASKMCAKEKLHEEKCAEENFTTKENCAGKENCTEKETSNFDDCCNSPSSCWNWWGRQKELVHLFSIYFLFDFSQILMYDWPWIKR